MGEPDKNIHDVFETALESQRVINAPVKVTPGDVLRALWVEC